MSYEPCTKNDGISFPSYDIIRKIWNVCMDVFQASANLVRVFGKYIAINLPNGWILPIYKENLDLTTLKIPERKFWALQVGIGKTDTLHINIPLPKEGFREAWHAFVRPIDYKIPGSELWFYNVNGVVDQGVNFSPQRQFGLLGDGLPVAKDILLAGLIIGVIYKLGLVSIARKIYSVLYEKYWWNIEYDAIEDTKSNTYKLLEQTSLIVDESNIRATDLKGTLDEIKQHINEIKGAIGLRLALQF